MGERHLGFFLWVILAAVVVVAATQSCPDGNDWLFHIRTETCMKLFTTQKTYLQAREDCKGLRGGSRRDSAGHLVFIFDEETDNFVKGLLRASSTTRALIGLNDYTRIGNYQWDDNVQPLQDYTGWASGNPYNSSDHTSVVITANGWEKYVTRWQASFVCQVKVVYPIPTLTCPPPAEVGQQSTITYCIIDVPAQVSISEMSFKTAERAAVSCYSSRSCSQSQSYRATMTTGASGWSSSLQIKKVDRRDAGSWTCSVKFSNNQEVTSNPCTFKVYVLPTKVECTERYLQSGIEVSCRTEIMYPQAVCQWQVTRNSYIQVQQVSNMSSTHENVTGMSYYRTVCNAYVYDRSAGVYLFKVSVRPDLPGLDWDQTSAVRTGNTNVTVAPPRVTSFSINNKEDTIEVAVGSSINLRCTSTGYPQYQLSLLYYLDGKETWKTVNNSEVSHTMTTTCRSMGRYACLAEKIISKVRNTDIRYVDLRVRCAPEYCHHTGPNPKFGVAVGSNSSFKMCVVAYPRPTSFRLFQDYPKELEKSRYNASFDYTNETTARGEITVNIFSLTQKDLLSVYELLSGDKYLKFELVPRVPPSCPENLAVSQTFTDSVTLSWKPGYDGGLQQSFTVLRYDSGLMAAPHIVSVIPQPMENSEVILSYNITGLSESTSYIFGIQTENDEGVTECPHIQVQVSTEASPLSSNDQFLTTIVVPVVISLILVIPVVVVVVFLVVRKRRSRGEKLGALITDTVNTTTIHTSSSSNNDVQEHFYETVNDRQSSTTGVLKADTRQTSTSHTNSTGENDGQENAYETLMDEQSTSGVLNIQTGQTSFTHTSSLPRTDGQKINYENVIEGQSTEGNNKEGNGQVENNEAVVYLNMSRSVAPKTGETAAQDSVYYNFLKGLSDEKDNKD